MSLCKAAGNIKERCYLLVLSYYHGQPALWLAV